MASPYLKAALITAAIVLLGFFFISTLDELRAQELRQSVEELTGESESDRLLLLYSQVMENSSAELCGYVTSTTQSKADAAWRLAEKISFYEQGNMFNSEYARIRNQYYAANAALYLNLQAANKYCGGGNYTTVLFFYRIEPDCPECRAQGGALDNLRAQRSDLRVFAFPLDSGQKIVDVFASRHAITYAPSLVINDSAVVRGFRSEGELSTYLG